jgi:ParB/RepB/Spo0J family partition protein
MGRPIGKQVELPLDRLHPDPKNPRLEVGDVTELAASIREVGLLVPILVSPSYRYGIGHYEIEAGERRWTACRAVGLETAPCRVRDAAVNETGEPRLVNAIIENVHRLDLNAMEKAQALGRLRDEYKHSQTEIAKLTGIDAGTVSRYLSLLELTPGSQDRVRSGKVTVGEAIDAVRKQRSRDRKKKGFKPVSVGWEPLWFARTHPLANKARTMCDARAHNNRRRLDGVACGQCFETVIRNDQDIVRSAATEALGVTFIAPTRESIRAGNGEM